ncbi:MAG TPA: SRPBCC family protein [Streptomyces sp.]|uniref:SRPBCC family protein n=1 Tax=Streptomyces sp. TaxID=1931 RepID=UPI002BBBFE71|nr:SRPBCC family protein [Streptomyces sp.]HWU09160.1 SRPBCC family protein [Streptomyces sp.]
MAIRHHLIHHPPSALWAVLEQPDQYGKWVVGTQDSRLLEGRWPEVGSSIEYTVRLGPKELQGRTTVRRLERPGALELEAYSGALGTARIAFDIRPWGDKTLVLLDEHPLQGLGGILHNAALDAVMQIRHRAMLGRLAEVVDAQAAEGRPAG